MKTTFKDLDKNSCGSIGLIAEEGEDLWHVYNLLSKEDILKATTFRKVVTEGATGSTEKSSHRITLSIKVESLFFDVQGLVLQVNGRNCTENQYVKMGGYHTLDLELNRPFTIQKQQWDFIHLDRLQQCCNISKKADIAAVVLEQGLASLCLVTESLTMYFLLIERQAKN